MNEHYPTYPNGVRCAQCGERWPCRVEITVHEEGPHCTLHGVQCGYDNIAARWFCEIPGCGYELEDPYEYG